MKAMILAAGLGTRLRPLTNKIPKPLFQLGGSPLLDLLIRKLEASGCDAVIVNTHHLAPVIEDFIANQRYEIPVLTRYEPILLETGGGIKNVSDFWDQRPFMVINGDIYTDIDFRDVYQYHLSHRHPVTMVLHDDQRFNHVWINSENQVIGFGITSPCPPPDEVIASNSPSPSARLKGCLAFTGVQVMDPLVLEFIPEKIPSGIIHAYCDMVQSGEIIQGFTVSNHFWHDIGTIHGYHQAARDALARKALGESGPCDELPKWTHLRGDGSDRHWHRVVSGLTSVVIVDHGPPSQPAPCEADAYYHIGNHLHERGVPLPRIYGYDPALGLVALEDLGDVHLQSLIVGTKSEEEIRKRYRQVLDVLVFMGVEGARGFDLKWTFQTPYFDHRVIMEKECRYFVTAFLQGYLEMEISFEELKEEFEWLAESASKSSYMGFLHRDFQSRNILVHHDRYYIIDFQGGRLGPLQYDLASLLIDPYVRLPKNVQKDLLSHYLHRLSERMPVDPSRFLRGFHSCAVTRNLQALGAFGFLSRVKGKTFFEPYIPPAVATLKENIHTVELSRGSLLKKIIEKL